MNVLFRDRKDLQDSAVVLARGENPDRTVSPVSVVSLDKMDSQELLDHEGSLDLLDLKDLQDHVARTDRMANLDSVEKPDLRDQPDPEESLVSTIWEEGLTDCAFILHKCFHKILCPPQDKTDSLEHPVIAESLDLKVNKAQAEPQDLLDHEEKLVSQDHKEPEESPARGETTDKTDNPDHQDSVETKACLDPMDSLVPLAQEDNLDLLDLTASVFTKLQVS